MKVFEREHAGDPEAAKLVAHERREIELFHSHGDARRVRRTHSSPVSAGVRR
jgi:hypothetical protein